MNNNVVEEITRKISPGTLLTTPSGRSKFVFDHIDSDRIFLNIGETRTSLVIPISCFQDIMETLKDKRCIKIGAIYKNTNEDTLDTLIKKYTHGTSASSYVASILEKAEIIEILKERPAKVRLL
jgi:hypothetical protein